MLHKFSSVMAPGVSSGIPLSRIPSAFFYVILLVISNEIPSGSLSGKTSGNSFGIPSGMFLSIPSRISPGFIIGFYPRFFHGLFFLGFLPRFLQLFIDSIHDFFLDYSQFLLRDSTRDSFRIFLNILPKTLSGSPMSPFEIPSLVSSVIPSSILSDIPIEICLWVP